MKAQTHTTLALAALAAWLPAQQDGTQADGAAALQRARLIERQEGDLKAALAAYEAVLQDPKAETVHAEAALRLGSLLWRLDRRDEAKQMMEQPLQAGGALAEAAKRVLRSDSQAAQDAQGREQKAEALLDGIEQIARPFRGRLINGNERSKIRQLETEIIWLGADAARVLARRAAVPANTAGSSDALKALQPLQGIWIELLWRIGTKPAQEHFLKVAKESPLPYQRLVTSRANQYPTDMAPVIAQFAKTNDPTGEVWRNVANRSSRLDAEGISTLLDDAHPATRSVGLRGASYQWSDYSNEQCEAFLARHSRAIEAVLATNDRRLRETAFQLLAEFANKGPTSATMIFLAHAHEFPENVGINIAPSVRSTGRLEVNADDAWLAAAAAAAKRLPEEHDDLGVKVQDVIRQLLDVQKIASTEAATDDILKLVELGYVYNGEQWFTPAIRRASPEQIARIIRSLPRRKAGKSNLIVRVLLQAEPGAAWFPAIRDTLAKCFESSDIPWRGHLHNGQVEWSNDVQWLVMLAGRSQHPDAVAWLEQLALRKIGLQDTCVSALIDCADDGNRAAIPVLRKMFGTSDQELPLAAYNRAHVFGALVRAGDEASLDVLVANYRVGHPAAREPSYNNPSIPRGLDHLCLEGPSKSGFSTQQQADLWQRLLAGDAANAVWSDLMTIENRYKDKKRSRPSILPTHALPSVANALQTMPKAINDRTLKQLLSAFGDVSLQDLQGNASLERAIDVALQHPSEQVSHQTFVLLRDEVAARFDAAAKAALLRLPGSKIRHKVVGRLAMTTDDWRPFLTGNDDAVEFALTYMDDTHCKGLREAVLAALTHKESEIRHVACLRVARTIGEGAAAALLPLLQDPDVTVRKAAKGALNDLREARSHAEYWNQAKNGIDTSPAGAAAKLIAQAMPDQDKQQRLLAIRSLALLKAPESLPYLIEWTKDKDADIKKAANQTIDKIHQQAIK